MNYGDLLVHVFQQDSRDFYSLERLWADAPSLRWNDLPDALDSSRD
jgi:ribosome-associated protein